MPVSISQINHNRKYSHHQLKMFELDEVVFNSLSSDDLHTIPIVSICNGRVCGNRVSTDNSNRRR